ncbi:ABC transporter permease [Nesterenkonia alkaliphila]|uniref:ABC transporter permease subunit n=1 Tax=Nesterenkonia alkaliphila TaxID=1463631 RepID=A0A7K1UMN0_9MICC|nr:ABC transporter permease [Nesterenkonia alkaliphila]MVT27728.1 ABC transporter permease subunit [Nesterenkonia alkaliphila]
MGTYIAGRLAQMIPTLLLIVTIVFFLVYVVGDPVGLMLGDNATPEQVAAMREAMGLNQPVFMQYLNYIGSVLTGDFGESYQYGQAALPIVLERLPATLTLAIGAILLALVIAIPLGVWSATHRGGVIDSVVSSISVLAKAMPNFWLGIMLILLFAVTLRWLPVSGAGSWAHLVLPVIALGTGTAAEITRLVRSSMIEILSQDYIRTAYGKGLRRRAVVYRHALLNAFVPVTSITILQFSTLIGGALVTEVVFSWPGLGQLLVNAVSQRDMALVQASVFVIAVMVLALSLISDLLFKAVDRRINLG